MLTKRLRFCGILLGMLGTVRGMTMAEEVYPAAILPFRERGADARELGAQVGDLLFAHLATNPNIYLVEREDLEQTLKELELNRSGLVKPAEAIRVGQLTGAKLLVTGSVLLIDGKLHLVAKIIGTETSRVLGAAVKGDVRDELDGLVEELAEQIAKTIVDQADKLVAKPKDRKDVVAKMRAALGKSKRPTVSISIPERHVGQATIDPAAETEIGLFCRELGFEVIDSTGKSSGKADILLTGEGFSEFASRHGNLISVKARLELKAVEVATNRVIAVDRQTSVAVDLTEQIAGKSALQEAAAEIAERLLPKLVDRDGKAKKSR